MTSLTKASFQAREKHQVPDLTLTGGANHLGRSAQTCLLACLNLNPDCFAILSKWASSTKHSWLRPWTICAIQLKTASYQHTSVFCFLKDHSRGKSLYNSVQKKAFVLTEFLSAKCSVLLAKRSKLVVNISFTMMRRLIELSTNSMRLSWAIDKHGSMLTDSTMRRTLSRSNRFATATQSSFRLLWRIYLDLWSQSSGNSRCWQSRRASRV
jgi:hypothetical protein